MSINSMKKQMRAILAALGLLALAGCSGGSSTEQNPVPDGPNVGADYVGPAAAQRRHPGVPQRVLEQHPYGRSLRGLSTPPPVSRLRLRAQTM